MEIKDKELLKIQIKNKIDKYIKEFPIFFYGNIIINLFLIIFLAAVAVFSAISIKIDARITVYGAFFLAIGMSILKITLKDFRRNFRIIKNIAEGHYDFEIEDYEMDNVVEFMEDLPKSRDDVSQLKVALSFDKILEILVASKIITFQKKFYDVDLKFKFNFEGMFKKNYDKESPAKQA